MTEQNFRTVFGEYLSDLPEVLDILGDTMVANVRLDMGNRVMHICLRLQTVLPSEMLFRAETALKNVVRQNKKRFESFKPEKLTTYAKLMQEYVSTVLPVWVQYRNTYIAV